MPDCSVSIGCWKKRGADRQGCRRLTGLAGEAPVLREDEKDAGQWQWAVRRLFF